MDAKYQKYYDTLKGKDYGSYVSKYKTTLSEVKTKLDGTEATISSSRWTEKGIQLIKSSVIPSLKSQASGIETGLSALSNACSKVSTLTSKLANLESLCTSLDNAKNALASASDEDRASKQQNVNYYQDRVNSLEREIDSTISDINGISVDIQDQSASFATSMETLKEYNSLEALKQEFLGSIDDDSWWVDPAYATKAKELTVFDNTTGKIYKEGDSFDMKVGETRILTVRVPHNAGHVRRVVRTTADGSSSYRAGNIVTGRSDIDPDPNNIEYVNYKWNHFPDEKLLNTISYDWIITATGPGTCTISQTCEYKVTENGGTPKAMVDIKVNVT